MRSETPRRSRPGATIMAVLAAGVAATAVAGCGGDPVDAGTPLAGRLITSDRLPAGFTAVPYQVGELIAANRSTLEQSAAVAFDPAECKPTADAAFNPQLSEENTVLLAAQSDRGALTALVSTVRRNVDADRRDTTGPCRVVTSRPSTGTLAGARIVNTSTELPAVTGDAVEQSYLVRTDSVTTFADGSTRSRSSFAANALVEAPSGTGYTVQVGVGGDGKAPPVSEEDFLAVVRSAVDRASQA